MVRAAAGAGFTLLETLLALVIIGVGVIAVINAQRSFLFSNQWSTQSSAATYLATELREMTRSFARHDRFSGGIYFTTPGDPDTFTGWGAEAGEDTIADIDDLDDLDGVVFGSATLFPDGFTMTRRFPGPINAFGEVIPEMRWDGSVETVEVDGEQQAVAMRGWSQIVRVEKVNPYNFDEVVDHEEQEVDGAVIRRRVDNYPVRVTVTILYQGQWNIDASPQTTVVSWVVPP
jgi:prepilin-type N-terminal cleavage/methylation domain-containing protein